MSDSGYPTLKPAFTITMTTLPQIIVGPTFGGSRLQCGVISFGTVRSHPGFGAEHLEGTIINGADYLRVEPDLNSVKLSFRSMIKTDDGEFVYFGFEGLINGNEETWPLLKGSPDAKSTAWGNSFVTGTFETSSEKWKIVKDKVFVGGQRHIILPDRTLQVELTLSAVC